MRILDARQTAYVPPYAKLVPAVAQASFEKASGAIVAPERQVVRIGDGNTLLSMSATGRRLAILDAPAITARRMAAVTLLGIQRLAKKTPESVLIIGTIPAYPQNQLCPVQAAPPRGAWISSLR